MTTMIDLRDVINSTDTVNFKPSENNILIRTEFKIATLKYKLSCGIDTKSDTPAGLVNIVRTVARINDYDSDLVPGDVVEINTQLEAIQGVRLDLTKKTFTKFTDILSKMLAGIDKILDKEFPTFTVVTYDLMPTRLVLGAYDPKE